MIIFSIEVYYIYVCICMIATEGYFKGMYLFNITASCTRFNIM